MAAQQSRYNLFKLLLLAGFLLGVALLVQTASTYVYVYRNLVIGAAIREADTRNQSLQVALRGVQDRETAEAATSTIEDLIEAWNKEETQVAWVRILDQKNESLTTVGGPNTVGKLPDLWPRVSKSLDERHDQPVVTGTEAGEAVIEIYAFYPTQAPRGGFGFGARRGGLLGPELPGRGLGNGGPRSFQPSGPPPTRGNQAPRGQGGTRGGLPGARGRPPMALEIAIPLASAAGPFESLRRTLIVGVGTSLALMASLALIALRLPYHLRGQQIDAQLEMARRVQTDLLAPPFAVSPQVDFSVDCVPAGEVGGDFCDVFSLDNGRVALVLGDVSGKGISAALLMGLIHGAIHSISWTESAEAHASATRHLNELLCRKTARERFSSLFWAYFDPARSTLHYVNAGHLSPFLIRRRSADDFAVQRLETGGTVLGLLPGVSFEQGAAAIEEGDLLAIFSDGLTETANSQEEQFGEARILDAIRESWERSAEEIRDTAMLRAREFIHNAPPNDDQTLIIARFMNLGSAKMTI